MSKPYISIDALVDPEKRCPLCNGLVEEEGDCPGYGSEGKVMVCAGSCDNASLAVCMNDDCDWWYREPNNRSDKRNMGIKPSWKTLYEEMSEWLRENLDESDYEIIIDEETNDDL